MSVPLDRLYNFLHDVCNHRDLIIYRFFPHGSRKLEDLTHLSSNKNSALGYEGNRVFYHDQEPLNFDLYKEVDINEFKLDLLNYSDDLVEKYKLVCKKVMPEGEAPVTVVSVDLCPANPTTQDEPEGSTIVRPVNDSVDEVAPPGWTSPYGFLGRNPR